MKTSKISYKAAISSKKLDAFFNTEVKEEEEIKYNPDKQS